MRSVRRLGCPLCADGGWVEAMPDVEVLGGWRMVCRSPTHGTPFRWPVQDPTIDDQSSLIGRLGLPEILLRCVEPGAGWAEHDVVEWRLRRQEPERYEELVAVVGRRAPGRPSRFDASTAVAVALAGLARSGRLHQRAGPATGVFRAHGQAAYWSADGTGPAISWEEWARREGLDPSAHGVV